MDGRLRILVVDDEPRLRSAWERLIRAQTDMEFVGGLDCADHLAETVRTHQPHLVLMDLSMGGKDPLMAMSETLHERPQTRTIVFSGHNDDETVQRALDAGAWGFVDKLEDPQRILEALRAVGRGDVVS